MSRLVTTALIFGACLAIGGAAHAQTYQRLGDTIIGNDGSMAQQLCNGVIITLPPPMPSQFGQLPSQQQQVFCQRLANTVVCN